MHWCGNPRHLQTLDKEQAHTHTHTLRLMRFATYVCCFWRVSAVYIICFFLQSVAAMTWCILFSLFTFVATLIYNKIFPEHVATISKYVCFILFPCHQSPSITINHHQSPCMVKSMIPSPGPCSENWTGEGPGDWRALVQRWWMDIWVVLLICFLYI